MTPILINLPDGGQILVVTDGKDSEVLHRPDTFGSFSRYDNCDIYDPRIVSDDQLILWD